MDTVLTVLFVWLICGVFLALMYFIQWLIDGCPLHAESIDDNPQIEDYYYLKGLAGDMAMSLVVGPVVLGIQLFTPGMSIFPRKRY